MKSDFRICVFCEEVSHKDTYVCQCGEYKGLMSLGEGIAYIGLDPEEYKEYFDYNVQKDYL